MLKQSINAFPFTLFLMLVCLVMPDTSQGILSENQRMIEASPQLKEKLLRQELIKEICGKDKNCRMFGPDLKLDQENVVGLVTFLAELDRQR